MEVSRSSVSYHVYIPRQSNLEAVTRNGGVSAQMVEGTLEFRAMNGGISLDQVGGDVRAETTNGGVNARLGGTTWRGRGLDLRTTNGGVSLTIPRGYNARLETGTTNGGMSVDFPITVQGRIGRHVETQLGSGGPLVRAITTNGGVRILSGNCGVQPRIAAKSTVPLISRPRRHGFASADIRSLLATVDDESKSGYALIGNSQHMLR